MDGGRRNRGIISLSIFAGIQKTTPVELETIKNVSLNGQIHNSQSIDKEKLFDWFNLQRRAAQITIKKNEAQPLICPPITLRILEWTDTGPLNHFKNGQHSALPLPVLLICPFCHNYADLPGICTVLLPQLNLSFHPLSYLKDSTIVARRPPRPCIGKQIRVRTSAIHWSLKCP